MPVTSFVFELFLFNSLYQYDWEKSLEQGHLVLHDSKTTQASQQHSLERFVKNRCMEKPWLLRRAFAPLCHIEDLDGPWTKVVPDGAQSQKVPA
jgi:hypothetical protein